MGILWTSITLAGLLAACPLVASFAGTEPQVLEEKDRGRTLSLQAGQKLLLYLRNPASGGYTANPPIFDPAVLRLVSQKKLAPESRELPRAGDFGRLFYEWDAVGRGETDIIISIYRPWEKKPPEEFWRVKVRVE